MAMGQRALNDEGILRVEQRYVLEHAPKGIDARLGPACQVGKRAFADLLAFAPPLAQKHGGRGIAVWNDFDIHGNPIAHIASECKPYTWEQMPGAKNPNALTNQRITLLVERKRAGTSD